MPTRRRDDRQLPPTARGRATLTRGSLGWVERADDAGSRLRLHGEVDLSNAAALEAEILSLIGESPGAEVVVDLAAVRYIDSQGIAVLVKLARALQLRQTALRLVAPTDSLAGELLAFSQLGELPVLRGPRERD